MGVYYNPTTDVTNGRVGRKLPTMDFDQAKGQLRGGEHMYFVCDRGFFWNVVCVDERSEFDGFMRQHRAYQFVEAALFALPEDAHQRALAGH